MESIIVGLLVVLIAAIVAVAIAFWRRQPAPQHDASQLLKQDILEVSRGLSELKDGLQSTVADRLERNSALMRDTIQKQLGESGKLVADVTEKLAKLDETNRRVVTVTDELKTLQNVLQNPKQRGVFGEYYLQSVLENVMPPGGFAMQHRFQDGEIVDAVIYLDRKKLLPVDSKFSLENYNRLQQATDKTEREKLAAAVKADLKLRIDETSKYIRPSEDTMDFAFMFIPSEAVYYDLLTSKVGAGTASSRDLLEYAFRDRHVIIVSPTSFMAYLQTVLQGLRSLQIEEQAKDIQVRVQQLGQHIAAYDNFMHKLGNSLGVTVGHYNTAHKELKKIDKDVMKIAASEAAIEPLTLDRPLPDEG